jgi:hypothetical protein
MADPNVELLAQVAAALGELRERVTFVGWKMGSDPDYFRNTMASTISINRAPVLTLWAAVVAERLGFEWDEVLTLGPWVIDAFGPPDGPAGAVPVDRQRGEPSA